MKEQEENKRQAISALVRAFTVEKEAANYFKLINAYGNLVHNNEELKGLGLSLGITVSSAGLQGGDEKLMGNIKEICQELGGN